MAIAALCLAATVACVADLAENPLETIRIGPENKGVIEGPAADGKYRIEFCPDSTCDGYEASSGAAAADLRDFAYLHLFYFSGYVYLESWRTQAQAREVARKILARPGYGECRGRSEPAAAGCIIRLLARTKGIKLYFVRYDEGARHVGPVDVEAETARPR